MDVSGPALLRQNSEKVFDLPRNGFKNPRVYFDNATFSPQTSVTLWAIDSCDVSYI
jgi:hypothetical protein